MSKIKIMPSLEEVLEFLQSKDYPSIFVRKRRKSLKKNSPLYICTKSIEVAQQIHKDISKKWTTNYTDGKMSLSIPIGDEIGFNDNRIKPHQFTKEEKRIDDKFRKRAEKVIPASQKLSRFLRENGTGLLRGMFKLQYIDMSEEKNKKVKILFSSENTFLGEYIAKIIDTGNNFIEVRLLDDPDVEVEMTLIYGGLEFAIGDFLALHKVELS